jgi:hypothetical protein
MNGGPYTGAVTTLLPPRVTVRAEFLACRLKVEGVFAAISMMKPRSNRTRMPSTAIPALANSSRGRSCRKSTPISSRIVIACSWIASTSSPERMSYGLRRFFHMVLNLASPD